MATGAADWVLATHNRGKLAEFRTLLGDVPIRLTALGDFDVTAPAETAPTFVENALIKARHAARATNRPAIADDSGLVVRSLGGLPGVRSARFAHDEATDEENVARLLDALSGRKGESRQAEFHCLVVALRHAADPVPLIAHGIWHGHIAESPRGRSGFGYDPVFVHTASGKTAAEMPADEKNRLSHRGRAIEILRGLPGFPEG